MSARDDYPVLAVLADSEPSPFYPEVMVAAAGAALNEIDRLRATIDRHDTGSMVSHPDTDADVVIKFVEDHYHGVRATDPAYWTDRDR